MKHPTTREIHSKDSNWLLYYTRLHFGSNSVTSKSYMIFRPYFANLSIQYPLFLADECFLHVYGIILFN